MCQKAMKRKKRIQAVAICVILSMFFVPVFSSVLVTAFNDRWDNNLMKTMIEEYIEFEQQNIDKLSQIWEAIDRNYNKWINGDINRETLAELSLKLLEELNHIKESYNKFKTKEVYEVLKNDDEMSMYLILSENLRLRTEVMLFDLVRGFKFENNPYSDRERLDDKVLLDVYEKRKNIYNNEQEYFKEQLKNFVSS